MPSNCQCSDSFLLDVASILLRNNFRLFCLLLANLIIQWQQLADLGTPQHVTFSPKCLPRISENVRNFLKPGILFICANSGTGAKPDYIWLSHRSCGEVGETKYNQLAICRYSCCFSVERNQGFPSEDSPLNSIGSGSIGLFFPTAPSQVKTGPWIIKNNLAVNLNQLAHQYNILF